MSESAWHPRVAEVVAALDASHRGLRQLVASIPAERRNAPSGDGRWSIAENLEHLAIVEDGTGRLISKLIKQLAEVGAQETERSSIGHSIDQFAIWKSDRKIVAPESVRPGVGLDADAALERLTASRERVMDAFRKGSGLALGSLTYPHPALGTLNVYQWGLFLAHHERRHAAQIREAAGLADD